MKYLVLISVAMALAACVQEPLTISEQGNLAYRKGEYETAYALLKPLAEAGDKNEQLTVATMYYRGEGMEKDYEEALKWLCRSAVQGDKRSISNIGHVIERDVIAELKNETAIWWYQTAADLDAAYGQLNLAQLYLGGKGINQNYEQAYLWASLSHGHNFTRDHESLKVLRLAEKKMISAQVTKIESQIKNWKVSEFDDAMENKIRTSVACSKILQVDQATQTE